MGEMAHLVCVLPVDVDSVAQGRLDDIELSIAGGIEELGAPQGGSVRPGGEGTHVWRRWRRDLGDDLIDGL